jgi:hypothetical protein
MLVEKINEAEVRATWSPIIESSTGIKDQVKLDWMSKYCAYHKLAEDKGMVDFGSLIMESIYNNVHLNPGMNVPGMGPVQFPGNPGTTTQFHSQAPGSGDKPFSLLPLSMQVAGQTIGLDLLPVVPLGGPFGMLTYLDFPYAGGNLNTPSAVINGLGGADGRVAPLMIKSNVTFATGFIPSANDVFYTTDGNNVAYKMTYVAKSRIDGFAIFKVEASSDETETDVTIPMYRAGQETDTTLADIFTSGSAFVLSTDGDVANAVSAELANPAELVKALEDHVTAFSGRGFKTGDVTSNDPYLREEGESTPDNLIGLKLFNQSVKAGTLQVAAAVTREQVQDLKQYGIDAIAQVEAVLINELTQGINKHILDRIFRLGNTNSKQVYNLDGTNLSLVVAQTTGSTTVELGLPMDSDNIADSVLLPTPHVIPTAGDNGGTLQRKILSRILAASNLIAIRGRRGAANFAVTNGQVATALQDIAGFVPYPLSNTVNQSAGSLYPIGSVAGVNIYVDPNMGWNDTRIAIGRKGDGNSPGLVFMPYLMAESVSTIAEGTMAPKISVKSRYALVEAGFHPQTMYYTLSVVFQDYQMV